MSLQQYLPQLIFLVVFVVGPLVKYLIKKASEQHEKKARQDAEEARQREMLRTGRDVNAERAAAEARQMREAMARQQAEQQQQAEEARTRQAGDGQSQAERARRQEQLRRLRERRQREQGAAQQGQSASPVSLPDQAMPGRRGGAGRAVTRELWPGGPVVVIAAEDNARAEQARSEQERFEQERAARVGEVVRAAQERNDAVDQSFVQPIAQIENVRSIERASPAVSRTVREVSARRGATLAGTPGVPLNAAQWRQAFVASQIFGRPGGLA